MKVGILCGGPSLERGISLNSARSVLDHLGGDGIDIVPFYFDTNRSVYRISQAQLYSNTPSDFDFKLKQTSSPLDEAALIRQLQDLDIVFPVIHGAFGEGGQLQAFLERHNIPFVGSPSAACAAAFDKYTANELIRANGFYIYEQILIQGSAPREGNVELIHSFFQSNSLERVIVKPAAGGSSICVFSVETPEEAADKADLIFDRGIDDRVVLEPFVQGREFTSIVLENPDGEPVSLVPTEIETDYAQHQIFDYRKKYLPTCQVVHHCPPRFNGSVLEDIRSLAEKLFRLFGMHDFARFDGWLDKDGHIWFSDFNPISGMEQNSFLFQQASRVGISHRVLLRSILANACRRQGLPQPEDAYPEKDCRRKPVHVLFGGSTSERQVSLMSGTNAWLKLRRSSKYDPQPYLLDLQHQVWRLPYALTLYHTVEEIVSNCATAAHTQEALRKHAEAILKRLRLNISQEDETFFIPETMSLEEFLERSDFVFLGLHGGFGEDGTIQGLLDQRGVKYNGSDAATSRLGMDKLETGRLVDSLGIHGLRSVPKRCLELARLTPIDQQDPDELWQSLCTQLEAETLIVKPRADGCSSGIIHLSCPSDLKRYIRLLEQGASLIPKNTFPDQRDIVEMPLGPCSELLFETFIETDETRVVEHGLSYRRNTGWIEITAGVLEMEDDLLVFNPSLTVTEGKVLTVEEKFQGGTGINITPPPDEIVTPQAVARTKQLLKAAAGAFAISDYARLDAFMHVDSGDVMLIEVNTLPALTPSTVLYQQALNVDPPIFPRALLEQIIGNTGY